MVRVANRSAEASGVITPVPDQSVFLPKPYTSEQLSSAIGSLLSGVSSSAPR